MPDREVPALPVEDLVGEDVRDEAHVAMQPEVAVARDRDAGALLAAVLDGEEREVRPVDDLVGASVDADDAAGLADLGPAVDRARLVDPGVRERSRVSWPDPARPGPRRASASPRSHAARASSSGTSSGPDRQAVAHRSRPARSIGTPASPPVGRHVSQSAGATLTTIRDCVSAKSATCGARPAASVRAADADPAHGTRTRRSATARPPSLQVVGGAGDAVRDERHGPAPGRATSRSRSMRGPAGHPAMEGGAGRCSRRGRRACRRAAR